MKFKAEEMFILAKEKQLELILKQIEDTSNEGRFSTREWDLHQYVLDCLKDMGFILEPIENCVWIKWKLNNKGE